MTTPLACLMIVALMPYVCAWTGAYFKYKQFGTIDNKNPRQQTARLEGIGARAAAAQANAWEALGVFTAAVVTSHLAGATTGKVAFLAQLFVVTRIAHLVLYLLDLDLLRSGVWIVGFVCAISMFATAC
jgi:uncharacterized MAPEG superfamily protein